MRRERLRPVHSGAVLDELYAPNVSHTYWPDHVVRVEATIGVARFFDPVQSVADLAYGDGAIVRAIVAAQREPIRVQLGDLMPRPVPESLNLGTVTVGDFLFTVTRMDPTDLLVATEILEHVDDPLMLLAMARRRARRLLLSTPVGAFGDANPEHYWAWDAEAVDDMLNQAGWSVDLYASIGWTSPAHPYTFGIWAAS